ncbi:hypothetical protein [Phormidium tenue]|uniref:Uncharacterized protein n=1 Tax=Phormidium tenue NIES-30 TaxID=549789 RepID=A0A1U7JB14_9CYAN|nr:hypothetical protein [Phormidium tenue]MBD2230228.1 hypothetical protein [Phormidium tenue FACHB-1052]OKH50951.1 hypothetical protein NIES30_02420 [Phormidium tenue NIES-30]
MAGSQIEQWHEPELKTDPAVESAATAAAITLAPLPTLPPRPRWQRRLAIAAGVGALGGLGGLLWWVLRTPPHPYVMDISPSQSEYAIARGESPSLSWQVSNPRQVQTMLLRGYAPDGTLVFGPETYDLSEGLPVGLLPYCDLTRRLLTCRDVPLELREPGQYRFELTLLPDMDLNLAPIQAESSLVTVADLPQPTVVELVPDQVIYSEAGTQVSANTPTLAPPVTDAGIRVSWIVTNPASLQDLLLVVKRPDGTTLGGRRFALRKPDGPAQVSLPEELQPFCKLEDRLICQGVPSGMLEVGQYQFELTPVPANLGDRELPAAKQSEVVNIQPRPVRIASFTINGREAQPKYLVPVEPGQQIPGFQVAWRVEGGSTAKVELLPSPGTVGLQGALSMPLSPAGTTTVTLRVTDGQNPPLVRAVTFETFNPRPNQPVIINQGGGTASSSSQTAPAPRPTPSPTARPRDPLGESLRTRGSTPGSNLPDLQSRPPEELDLNF